MDLQVFATPRIILRPLVPTFPCFANITVTLIDKVNWHMVIYKSSCKCNALMVADICHICSHMWTLDSDYWEGMLWQSPVSINMFRSISFSLCNLYTNPIEKSCLTHLAWSLIFIFWVKEKQTTWFITLDTLSTIYSTPCKLATLSSKEIVRIKVVLNTNYHISS